jgi:hypothetical protein
MEGGAHSVGEVTFAPAFCSPAGYGEAGLIMYFMPLIIHWVLYIETGRRGERDMS